MMKTKHLLLLCLIFEKSVAEENLIKVLSFEKAKFTKTQTSFGTPKKEFAKVFVNHLAHKE